MSFYFFIVKVYVVCIFISVEGVYLVWELFLCLVFVEDVVSKGLFLIRLEVGKECVYNIKLSGVYVCKRKLK